MKSLCILQLGPYPPPRGGVQSNMLAIHDEILERGHISKILAITKSQEIADEPNVHHPKNPFHFLSLLRSIKHDVLHLHIGGNLPVRVKLMMIVCTVFSAGKKIITFHSGGYANSGEGKKASPNSMAGYAFRKFDFVIVVNSMMIELFKKFGVGKEKIGLIPPYLLKRPDPNTQIPLKLERFIRDHDQFLISVGLLESDYDLPLQIEVLEDVLKQKPNTGLVIVGSGSLDKEPASLIQSKSYDDHILLAGDTDREVVLHLIEKSAALLRTTKFDGDAISVREALFLGTPVIATDNGMRPEGVSLIPLGSGDDLRKEILKALAEEKSGSKSAPDGSENIAAVVDLYERMHAG